MFDPTKGLAEPTTDMVYEVLLSEMATWKATDEATSQAQFRALSERLIRYFGIFRLEMKKSTILPGLPGGQAL